MAAIGTQSTTRIPSIEAIKRDSGLAPKSLFQELAKYGGANSMLRRVLHGFLDRFRNVNVWKRPILDHTARIVSYTKTDHKQTALCLAIAVENRKVNHGDVLTADDVIEALVNCAYMRGSKHARQEMMDKFFEKVSPDKYAQIYYERHGRAGPQQKVEYYSEDESQGPSTNEARVFTHETRNSGARRVQVGERLPSIPLDDLSTSAGVGSKASSRKRRHGSVTTTDTASTANSKGQNNGEDGVRPTKKARTVR